MTESERLLELSKSIQTASSRLDELRMRMSELVELMKRMRTEYEWYELTTGRVQAGGNDGMAL